MNTSPRKGAAGWHKSNAAYFHTARPASRVTGSSLLTPGQRKTLEEWGVIRPELLHNLDNLSGIEASALIAQHYRCRQAYATLQASILDEIAGLDEPESDVTQDQDLAIADLLEQAPDPDIEAELEACPTQRRAVEIIAILKTRLAYRFASQQTHALAGKATPAQWRLITRRWTEQRITTKPARLQTLEDAGICSTLSELSKSDADRLIRYLNLNARGAASASSSAA